MKLAEELEKLRNGLPPTMNANLDVFERNFEACINDEHTDILFTADTGIENNGRKDSSDLAVQTVDYRMAELLAMLYTNLPAILAVLRASEKVTEESIYCGKCGHPEFLKVTALYTQIDELERKCDGLQLMVDELKADRIDLLAQKRTLQQALAEAQATLALDKHKYVDTAWANLKECRSVSEQMSDEIDGLEAALQAEREKVATMLRSIVGHIGGYRTSRDIDVLKEIDGYFAAKKEQS